VAVKRTLVVGGTGVISGIPDQCVLHISLNGVGSTPAETLDICSTAAEAAIKATVDAGVARDDIRTMNLSVQDRFDQSQQKVTARVGSYQLQVTVRDLTDLSRVLAVLSEAAGDTLQIRSIQLGLKDAEPVRREARRLAVRDARGRAQDLAGAAQITLGRIIGVEDGDISGPSGRSAIAVSSASRASMPVEPGEVSIGASVVITYAIASETHD
jgi:uncharacterized protein